MPRVVGAQLEGGACFVEREIHPAGHFPRVEWVRNGGEIDQVETVLLRRAPCMRVAEEQRFDVAARMVSRTVTRSPARTVVTALPLPSR